MKENLLQIQVRLTSFLVSLENQRESSEDSHMNMSVRREVRLKRAKDFPLQLIEIREAFLTHYLCRAELLNFLLDPCLDLPAADRELFCTLLAPHSQERHLF